MPVNYGSEKEGGKEKYFYKWGRTGTKYYFHPESVTSRIIARDRATKQGDAIKSQMKKAKRIG